MSYRKPPMELTVEINGQRYFTVKDFARVTNHSEQSIRFLIMRGNRVRKLRIITFLKKPLIPAAELTEFPFTCSGRSEKAYYFTLDGKQVMHDRVQNETVSASVERV